MESYAFTGLLKSRRSVRSFEDRPIPENVLAQILEDARECASWSNTRPYCIALASGERLQRLAISYTDAFDRSRGLRRREPVAFVKALFTGALPTGDFRPWKRYHPDLFPRSQAVGRGLYKHLGIARADRNAREEFARQNLMFFGAPTVMWLFVHQSLLPFSAMDAGIVLQTVMLSARANGLGSCPLGILSAWRHPVDQEFEVPKHYKLITGLALGYPSDSPVNDFRAQHPQ